MRTTFPQRDKGVRQHAEGLEETFATLRRYDTKLNREKCVFWVTSRKFLGYMVTRMGIEANPEKIKVVPKMAPRSPSKESKSEGT